MIKKIQFTKKNIKDIIKFLIKNNDYGDDYNLVTIKHGWYEGWFLDFNYSIINFKKNPHDTRVYKEDLILMKGEFLEFDTESKLWKIHKKNHKN